MRRWHKTTKTDKPYEFLLLGRFDFRGDAGQLYKLCSKYATTKYITLPGRRVGHPLGCNEMWAKGMIELRQLGYAEFGLWMEYDVMPKDPDWFNYIYSMWDPNFLVCGHLVTDDWLDANGFPSKSRKKYNWGEHINGAAMYNPKITNHLNLKDVANTNIGWDVQIYNKLDKTLFKGFPMYDFRLNPSRTKNSTDGVLIHGLKTIQEKREVYRELS
jgi:hypothetical protein